MPAYSLRPTTPEDDDLCLAIYRAGRPEVAGWGWPAELATRFLESQLRVRGAAYGATHPGLIDEIVMQGDDAAGRLLTVKEPGSTWVIDITLSPEFRNRGLGASILRDLMHGPVRLSVLRDNPARALYRSLGFVVSDAPATDELYEALVWRPGAGD